MRIEQLMKEDPALPLEDFLARHPVPCLLIEPFGESTGALIETPSSPNLSSQAVAEATRVFGAAEAARALARMGQLLNPLARIEWLSKSERNPFASILTVGRARNNDVVVDTPTVSKLHAIFTHPDQSWYVEDDRSSNGTFLNGVEMRPKQKMRVSDGDSIRLGPDVLCRFMEAESLYDYLRMAASRT